MVITRTDLQYAEALYELAAEAGRTDRVAPQLRTVQETVAGSAQALQLLGHPSVDVAGKLQVAMAGLSDPEPLINDFLRLVIERGRPHLLLHVADAFQAVQDRYAGVLAVQVETAIALTPAQHDRLAAALARLAGAQVRLEVEVKPELIGGVRVRLGDRLLDGSVEGRLERLAELVSQPGA
jgi:F-type H+-transporting ATPase subunit delta